MPNRSSKKQGPEDTNETAFRVFQEAIGEAPPKTVEAPKNAAAVELGRLGGRKGGKARAKSLSPEQRHAIAQKQLQHGGNEVRGKKGQLLKQYGSDAPKPSF